MTFDAEDFTCSVCKSDQLVLPYGPKGSPILLVGDAPGSTEVQKGIPFTGNTGKILQTELGYRGVDSKKIRKMNLWKHPKNSNKECLQLGEKDVLAEAKGRRIILLVGADTVKHFCDASVEEWNGLLVPTNYFSGAKVMAMVQPATCFHGTVGELRFALDEFVYLMRQEKLI